MTGTKVINKGWLLQCSMLEAEFIRCALEAVNPAKIQYQDLKISDKKAVLAEIIKMFPESF